MMRSGEVVEVGGGGVVRVDLLGFGFLEQDFDVGVQGLVVGDDGGEDGEIGCALDMEAGIGRFHCREGMGAVGGGLGRDG